MAKLTLSEMAKRDIEMHTEWKLACAYHMRLRRTPKAQRDYAKKLFSSGVYAAGANARYLHKAWANWRDLRIAAGGSVIKYPKIQSRT